MPDSLLPPRITSREKKLYSIRNLSNGFANHADKSTGLICAQWQL